MALKIVRLKILVNTIDGDYGVDIPFSSGLFILRIDNTHGKSTCMNAIAYALGMEKALGLGRTRVPFPPSLTKALANSDGEETNVISSKVFLEIENAKNDVVTLERQVMGSSEDNIIEVSKSCIDDLSTVSKTKLFLHKEGDTTRELGFFHWLASFIGWELPYVPTIDGKEVPLYPSTIFPLWFVEQKKGWASIQSTTPVMFKIRDVKKRAVEFLLNLDVNDIVKKRAKLKSDIANIQSEWKITHRRAEMLASRVFGQLSGVSEEPEAKFDRFKVDISIKNNDSWDSIVSLSSVLNESLKKIENESIHSESISVLNEQLQLRIDKLYDQLKKMDADFFRLDDEASFISYQISSTEKRLQILNEDKRKYEDLKKVSTFDVVIDLKISKNECPVCGQKCSENLLNMEGHNEVLSIDESLQFIKEQISAFKKVSDSYKAQEARKRIELEHQKDKIKEIRNKINNLKDSERLPEVLINEDSLREKINTENKLELYNKTIKDLSDIRLKFDHLHTKYKRLIKARRQMPESSLSKEDNAKLTQLQIYLRDLLDEYGFSSFKSKDLEVLKDTYLPTREGFDIGFDTSASDGIRIIWSYLISLFMLKNDFETNHPGLLIFDEPQQQKANKLSFSKLLESASKICTDDDQIIFATSEEKEVLEKSLHGQKYTLISFDKKDGKILKKL